MNRSRWRTACAGTAAFAASAFFTSLVTGGWSSPGAQRTAGEGTEKPIEHVFTTFPELTLERLVHGSEDVVWGRVLELQPVPDANDGPFTRCIFQVDLSLLGRPAGRIEVCLPGGEGIERDRVVHGAPHLSVGDECVLFVHRRPCDPPFGITGLAEGVYRVSRSSPEGRILVHGARLPGGMAMERFMERVGDLTGHHTDTTYHEER